MDMWRATYPFTGDIYVFRGRSGSLIKAIWHDGIGLSLYEAIGPGTPSCGRRRSAASLRDGQHPHADEGAARICRGHNSASCEASASEAAPPCAVTRTGRQKSRRRLKTSGGRLLNGIIRAGEDAREILRVRYRSFGPTPEDAIDKGGRVIVDRERINIHPVSLDAIKRRMWRRRSCDPRNHSELAAGKVGQAGGAVIDNRKPSRCQREITKCGKARMRRRENINLGSLRDLPEAGPCRRIIQRFMSELPPGKVSDAEPTSWRAQML